MAYPDDLFQAALDGTLSEGEASRIASLLEKDPQAAARFHALQQADRALSSLKAFDAPPEIRQGVMRQIRLQQAVSNVPERARRGSLRSWWHSWFPARPAFQMGLGFALGVLVLLPVLWSSSHLSVDPALVSGALGKSRNLAAGVEALEISADGVSGSLLTQLEGDVLRLELQLRTSEEVDVQFEFQRPTGGLVSLVTDWPAMTKLEYTNTHLRLGQAGTGSYTFKVLTVEGVRPPMRLLLTSNGESVLETAVP